MLKTVRSSAILILMTIPAVLAQQPSPSHIADDLLAMDANGYLEFGSGPTIEELIANRSQYDPEKGTYVVAFHPREEAQMGGGRKQDALSDIRGLTYNSDAVVLATPISRRSALTASHKFIFSDYEIRIDAVFADYRGTLANAPTAIVSRAGGEIELNGNKVRAIETEFPLFHLGEQYLFFLQRLPSGSYSVRPSGAFLVSGASIKAARNHPKRESIPHLLSRIEQEISSAAAENPRRPR